MLRTTRNILGILIVVLCLFAALEVSARFYARAKEARFPEKPSPAPVTVVTRELRESGMVFHAPRQDYVDTRIPARKYHVRINSHGFRGAEFPREKPEGVTRIMLLGDSFTFGDGVNDEETLPAQLEKALNAGRGGRYEAINAGFMGARLEMETELFHYYGSLFKPDIVILGYVYNDIPESAGLKYLDWAPGKKGGGTAARLQENMRGLAFYNMILQKKAEREFKKRGLRIRKIEQLEKGASPAIEKAIGDYKTGLLKFAGELRADNTGFLFVIFPTRLSEGEIKRPLNGELLAFAEANGLRAVDLRSSWLKRNGDINHFFDIDEHPNAEAFRISAEVIAEKLLREKE